jgi:HEAT repeat protein
VENKTKNSQVAFEKIIAALLDISKPFPVTYLHQFSDLSLENLAALKKVWEDINNDRRANFLRDLEEIQDADTLVCFDEIGKLALLDLDARIRLAGISLLWGASEPRLLPTLIQLLQQDPEETVRASAAGALGPYVLDGELEELDASTLKKVEEALLNVMGSSEKPSVKQRCLEALGYSSREEVTPLIEAAFENEDGRWKASALFAMGRTENQHWKKKILDCLRHPEPEVQLEAIRSAGGLSLPEARKILISMLSRYDELDGELQETIIWSLSQIGGEKVFETLEKMLELAEGDEEREDFVQDAIDNLEFTESMDDFELFEVNIPDEEELMIEDILEEEDDTEFPIWRDRVVDDDDEDAEE